MKNHLLFLVFIACFAFGQEYKFDTSTVYLRTGKNHEDEYGSFCLTNSKDQSYYLRFFKNKDSLNAELFDYKNQKTHYFKIQETKNNNEIHNKFIFDFTYNSLHYYKDSRENYVYEFETLKTIDSLKKIRLKVFKNHKKKKTIFEMDFELKKNSTNSFNAFRVSFIHPYEFEERLLFPENYLVTKANVSDSNFGTYSYKLIDYKKIDLIIQIPKQ